MKIKMLFIVMVAFALTACGGSGGGGSASTPGTAPIISNLHYSPASATYMQGGGAVEVSFSFNFGDPDMDISTLTLTHPPELPIVENISNWPGLKGKTGGTIYFTVPADTSEKNSFDFQLWVTDSKGNNSNKLSGSFTVQ